MAPADQNDPIDRTDELLDALLAAARGGATEPVSEIDPVLSETTRRLDELDAAGIPDGTLVMRIWEDLMNQTTSAATLPLGTSIAPLPALNGRVSTGPRQGGREEESAGNQRWLQGRWVLAQVAAAAILLLTVVGIYRIYSEGGPSGNGSNGAIIPAAEQCGTSGSQASVPAGSPVALDVMVASPDGATVDPVSFIWQTDGAPVLPEFVTHMAIDPACRLWVMDLRADRFLIFDLDGNLLETWGTSGSGEGQFDFATAGSYMYNGIAFASDGGFYVSDAANGRVQHFDADRQFVRSWAINDSDGVISATSSWIAVGPDGNVYVVVNTDRGMIQVYSPDGELVRAFGSLADGPDHLSSNGPIAFDPTGHLWVMDRLDGSLVEFSPAGEIVTKLEPQELGTFAISPVGTEPIGLAIDATGRFFVTDIASNNVFVYDPSGTFLFNWGGWGVQKGEFYAVFAVALDHYGGVYVTDGGVPRIQKFQVSP